MGPHPGNNVEGCGRIRILFQLNIRIRKGRDPPDHPERQAITQGRIALSRQHPQHCTLECITGFKGRYPVLPEGNANSVEKFVGNTGSRRPDSPYVHAKARIIGRAQFAGLQGHRSSAENFLDIDKGTQLMPHLGQLVLESTKRGLPRIVGQSVGQRRLEKSHQFLRPGGVRIETEHDPANLLANALHRNSALGWIDAIGRLEIRNPQLFVAFGTKQDCKRVALAGEFDDVRGLADLAGVVAGINYEQNIARGDLLACTDTNLTHGARNRCLKTNLHFHGFEQSETLARLDALALFNMQGHHHRRRCRTNLTRCLEPETVGPPIEFKA